MFALCENLRTLRILDGVTLISSAAFLKCTNLQTVYIPDSVIAGRMFEGWSLLETIGSYAFAGCPALIDVTIPASVNAIGTLAFGYTIALDEQSGTEVFEIMPGFRVAGYRNTSAQMYAQANGFAFTVLDNNPSDADPPEVEVSFLQKIINFIIDVIKRMFEQLFSFDWF